MSSTIQVKLMPTVAALVPVAVQAEVTVTLLAVVGENFAMTILGGIAGLVWLKVGHVRLEDQYGDLQLQRRQFIALGRWLGQEDAAADFDRMANELMTDGSLEDDSYMVGVVSDSIASAARTGAAVLLQVYLLVAAYRWWTVTYAI